MKIQVGFFFGGRSVEHEVSVISAVQAMAALDADRYEAVPVYITKEGHFYTGAPLRDISEFRDLSGLLRKCQRMEPTVSFGSGHFVAQTGWLKRSKPAVRLDVAIPVTHGSFGEDGCLQGLFELMGLPYAGCGVTASALGMDKSKAKVVWAASGLPVTPGVELTSSAWFEDEEACLERVEAGPGWPVVVKPAALGSSVGLNTAKNAREFKEAMEDTTRYTDRVLVEEMVQPLRELNVSVLGDDGQVETSVCEEPLRADEVLSFKDKYESGSKSQGMQSLQRQLPALISEALSHRVRDLAARAFQSLGASGVARVDFLYHEPTDTVYVNEINTIPGSLSFYLWEASGVAYPELLHRMIQLALKRQRQQGRLAFSFATNILANFSGSKAAKSGGRA